LVVGASDGDSIGDKLAAVPWQINSRNDLLANPHHAAVVFGEKRFTKRWVAVSNDDVFLSIAQKLIHCHAVNWSGTNWAGAASLGK